MNHNDVVSCFDNFHKKNTKTLSLFTYDTVKYIPPDLLFGDLNLLNKEAIKNMLSNIRYVGYEEFVVLLNRIITIISLENYDSIIIYMDRYIPLVDILILSYIWPHIRNKVIFMTYSFDKVVEQIDIEYSRNNTHVKTCIITITESLFTTEKIKKYNSKISMDLLKDKNTYVMYIPVFCNRDVINSVEIKYNNFILYHNYTTDIPMIKTNNSNNKNMHNERIELSKYGHVSIYTFYSVMHINILFESVDTFLSNNNRSADNSDIRHIQPETIEYARLIEPNKKKIEDISLPYPFGEYMDAFGHLKNDSVEYGSIYNDGVYLPLVDLLIFNQKYHHLEHFKDYAEKIAFFSSKFHLLSLS